jgi:hypothetical protein
MDIDKLGSVDARGKYNFWYICIYSPCVRIMNENNACFGVTCLLPRGNEDAQEVLRGRRRERQSSLPRFVIVREMTTMFTQSHQLRSKRWSTQSSFVDSLFSDLLKFTTRSALNYAKCFNWLIVLIWYYSKFTRSILKHFLLPVFAVVKQGSSWWSVLVRITRIYCSDTTLMGSNFDAAILGLLHRL